MVALTCLALVLGRRNTVVYVAEGVKLDSQMSCPTLVLGSDSLLWLGELGWTLILTVWGNVSVTCYSTIVCMAMSEKLLTVKIV